MERPISPVPLARVGGNSRRMVILVALAAVLVAAAVAKPWAGPISRGAAGAAALGIGTATGPGGQLLAAAADTGRTAFAPAGATPARASVPGPPVGVDGAARSSSCCAIVAAADLVEANGMPICYTPDGWRVVADTEENGTRSRIWLPVDASAAGGPGDPGVPLARLIATRIVALGFCAPAGGRPVGTRTAILWSELPAGTPAGIRYVRVATLHAAAPADGALAAAAPGRAAWLPGRYVVQVLGDTPGRGAAWFGLLLAAPAP